MKILTAQEMRETDRITVKQFGVPSLTLMENAGSAVARFVRREFSEHRKIVVLCGKGNNGGDGFVAARVLTEARLAVSLLLLGDPAELKGDSKVMFERLPSAPPLALMLAKDEAALHAEQIRSLLESAELFLDAVVGTGFQPPLRG